jgi:hypothetical protein
MESIGIYIKENRRNREILEELLEKNAYIDAQMNTFMKNFKKESTDASTQTKYKKTGFIFENVRNENTSSEAISTSSEAISTSSEAISTSSVSVLIHPELDDGWVLVKNGLTPRKIIVPEVETSITTNPEEDIIVVTPLSNKKKRKNNKKKNNTKKVQDDDDEILLEENIQNAIIKKQNYEKLKDHLQLDDTSNEIAKIYIRVLFSIFKEKFTVFSKYNGDNDIDDDKKTQLNNIIMASARLYASGYRCMHVIPHDPHLPEIWNFLINIKKSFIKKMIEFVDIFGKENPITLQYEINPGVNTIHDIYHSLHHTIDIISFLCEQRRYILEHRQKYIEPFMSGYHEGCSELSKQIYTKFVNSKFKNHHKCFLSRHEIQKKFSISHMKLEIYSEEIYKDIATETYRHFRQKNPKITESENKSTVYDLNYNKMSESTREFIFNAGIIEDTSPVYAIHRT